MKYLTSENICVIGRRENDQYHSAIMICDCGCGNTVSMTFDYDPTTVAMSIPVIHVGCTAKTMTMREWFVVDYTEPWFILSGKLLANDIINRVVTASKILLKGEATYDVDAVLSVDGARSLANHILTATSTASRAK